METLGDPRLINGLIATAAPRVLCIDDGHVIDVWGWFRFLPLANETVLYLRSVDLCAEGGTGGYATRHMIFHRCWASGASLSKVLSRFAHLETLVLFETDVEGLVSTLIALPTSLQHVHILEDNFEINEDRFISRLVLPHLESFTYTLLSSGTSAPQTPADDDNDGSDANTLAAVQQAVESSIAAPKCTFKFLCSTASPADALADALAAFKLDCSFFFFFFARSPALLERL